MVWPGGFGQVSAWKRQLRLRVEISHRSKTFPHSRAKRLLPLSNQNGITWLKNKRFHQKSYDNFVHRRATCDAWESNISDNPPPPPLWSIGPQWRDGLNWHCWFKMTFYNVIIGFCRLGWRFKRVFGKVILIMWAVHRGGGGGIVGNVGLLCHRGGRRRNCWKCWTTVRLNLRLRAKLSYNR
jgi:hypothetical protein